MPEKLGIAQNKEVKKRLFHALLNGEKQILIVFALQNAKIEKFHGIALNTIFAIV